MKEKDRIQDRDISEEEKNEILHARKVSFVYSHFFPVKKNKIVFSQFGGRGYGCNPKAICEEFLRRDEDYDLVWVLSEKMTAKKAGVPKGVRTIKGTGVLKELLTAKVWVNNIHFNVLIDKGLKKRKQTIYLNTFHGGITLKNEGKDHHSFNEAKAISLKERMYRKDAEMVDYVTCGCEMERHVLDEFYYGHGEILMLGDARTDILVNPSEQVINKVRRHYKIPDGTKIAIYAPTFRTDMSLKWYDLDFEGLLDALEEKYGCPWVMLVRLHPRLSGKTKKLVPSSDRFINAAGYVDMQELSAASDLMISDYSSVITDFMLTRHPAYMYVPDLDKYLKSRGLYFEMEELPFPYARNMEELYQCIRDFDQEAYTQKVDKFIEKLGYLADGKASERIVDFLIEKMNG